MAFVTRSQPLEASRENAYVYGESTSGARHLNTPRLVADATGTTVWRWDQGEPFGNNPADENPSGLGAFDLPLRLPGQRYDKETGLHYNYFRDYDPSLGRYGESDPIGLRAGLNTYAYVQSSPLRYIDPTGEKTRACCTPIAGGLLSAFNHCFIEQMDDSTGASTTYALHRVSFGVGCKYKNDSFDVNAIGGQGTTCGPWKDDKCANCVEKAHQAYPSPSNYFYLGPNSNTYAKTIAGKCGIEMPPVADTAWAPGTNDEVPPGLPNAVCPPKRL